MSEEGHEEQIKNPLDREQIQADFVETLTRKFENASVSEKDLEYKIDQKHLFCILRYATQLFSEVHRSYYSGETYNFLSPSEEFLEISKPDNEDNAQVVRRIVSKQSGQGTDWTQLVFEKDRFEISSNVRRVNNEDQDISVRYDHSGALVLISSSEISESTGIEPSNGYWRCEIEQLDEGFEYFIEEGRVLVTKHPEGYVRIEVFGEELQGGFVVPEKIDAEKVQDRLISESLLEDPYNAPREDDNKWLHANLLRTCGIERLYSDEADSRYIRGKGKS